MTTTQSSLSTSFVNNEVGLFSLFPRLRCELQDAIWKAALPDSRIITIQIGDVYQTSPNGPVPAVLHVCQNSRKLAGITYKLVSAPHLTTKRFNFNKDIVVLKPLHIGARAANRLAAFDGTISLLENLRYLVVDD